MLRVCDLSAGYKNMTIINSINLSVRTNEIVTIVGPNGSGKSTILRSIIGIIEEYKGRIIEGKVYFNGQNITDKKAYELLPLGIAFAPDGGQVFSSVSVMENLALGGFILNDKNLVNARIEDILDIFPILKGLLKRKAMLLSGGERQILSLAKSLITNPKLLLLDEPSSGLSPSYVTILFEKLLLLKEQSSILIAEQNSKRALQYSDRGYIIRNGKLDLEGNSKDLLDNEDIFRLL